MGCCGNPNLNKKPNMVVIQGYRTTEELPVTYTGKEPFLHVTGCFTSNRYIFLSNVAKMIDINDANCLRNVFEFQVGEAQKVVQSDSGETGE